MSSPVEILPYGALVLAPESTKMVCIHAHGSDSEGVPVNKARFMACSPMILKFFQYIDDPSHGFYDPDGVKYSLGLDVCPRLVTAFSKWLKLPTVMPSAPRGLAQERLALYMYCLGVRYEIKDLCMLAYREVEELRAQPPSHAVCMFMQDMAFQLLGKEKADPMLEKIMDIYNWRMVVEKAWRVEGQADELVDQLQFTDLGLGDEEKFWKNWARAEQYWCKSNQQQLHSKALQWRQWVEGHKGRLICC